MHSSETLIFNQMLQLDALVLGDSFSDAKLKRRSLITKINGHLNAAEKVEKKLSEMLTEMV